VLVFMMALVSIAIVDSNTVAGPPHLPRWGGAPDAVLRFCHPGARTGGRRRAARARSVPPRSVVSAPRVRPSHGTCAAGIGFRWRRSRRLTADRRSRVDQRHRPLVVGRALTRFRGGRYSRPRAITRHCIDSPRVKSRSPRGASRPTWARRPHSGKDGQGLGSSPDTHLPLAVAHPAQWLRPQSSPASWTSPQRQNSTHLPQR
jgi:hypothetical protein